ncbi:hypothetical protein GH5_02757 [Leishmania sp. Ghana 2012 LV757]|uniref:hypothetical protein n=1 Tax=Leishmania sp. Ghana 2012 LV757 TaxID=2803181 RepID=UPI001B560B8B|nr:hypothetical protein GH5_02757 [Leishmania sp. Ghana 2012 LV757]
MAAPGPHQAAQYQRPGSCAPPARQRLHGATLPVMHSSACFARYSFDPGRLLTQSIQEQLDRLYQRPKFDAGPRQQLPGRFRSYREKWMRSDRRKCRSRLWSSSAELRPDIPRHESSVLPSPVSTPSSTHLVSSLPSTQCLRPRRATATATPLFTSTLPAPSESTAWSQQRRKENLVENGLEPVQNLIGLDSYFAQHPNLAYRPLSAIGGGARAFAADPCSGLHLDGAGSRCGTRGRRQLPGSSSPPVPVFQSSSSVRRPGQPIGAHPRSVARARAARFSGQPKLFRRAASIPKPSSGRSGSASTFSVDNEDLFFDEDPLATEPRQTPETERYTAEARTAAFMQRGREDGKTGAQAASSAWVMPVPPPLDMVSLSFSAQHPVKPRASKTAAGPGAALNPCAKKAARSAAAGRPTAPGTIQPPCTREAVDLKRPCSPRHRYRAVKNLFEQVLRLRARYERAVRQGPCPCGVCDGSFLASSPHARRTAPAAQGVCPPSSTGATTVRTHGRLRPAHLHGRPLHPRPVSRDVHSSRLSDDFGQSAPDICGTADLGERDADINALLLLVRSRCDASIPGDAVAPAPPSVPRDGSSSGSRRGRPWSSSAAPPHVPLSQRSSWMSESSAAPLSIPLYCSPYRGKKAVHGRLFASVSEGRNVGRIKMRSTAGAPRRLDEDANDHRSLTQLLRRVLRDIRVGRKRSNRLSAKDASSGAASGAPHHDVTALLQALREELHLDDVAYAVLLRVLHGNVGGPVTGTAAAEKTELVSPTHTAFMFSRQIVRPPLAPQPPHPAGRCDVVMGTMADPFSLPRPCSDMNLARNGRPGAALHAHGEALPSEPTAVPEPLHTRKAVRSSPCPSSVSSIALSSDSGCSSLAALAFTSAGATDTLYQLQ